MSYKNFVAHSVHPCASHFHHCHNITSDIMQHTLKQPTTSKLFAKTHITHTSIII